MTQTWLLGVGLAVATTSACIAIHASALVTIATACVAAYLPSYLDGSEYTGERYWPWFATFIGHGMAHIPGTLEFEEPIDASKQHIFCSHPHGLLSTHHGLLMSGQTVPPFYETCGGKDASEWQEPGDPGRRHCRADAVSAWEPHDLRQEAQGTHSLGTKVRRADRSGLRIWRDRPLHALQCATVVPPNDCEEILCGVAAWLWLLKVAVLAAA
ncbi:hypothetical protein F442_14336 [Phytophthora nicotianae P10297]|uniref:Acyltransferase n=1 Tax=Phytophthora nicotianae P10297 TaxID=1317064 RepID=W2YSH9_PHYNI|nr:hypothetical protein F442_14336 [Phytophthora nicotianae P10297]